MKTLSIKTSKAELLIVELQTKVINSSYHIQKTPKGVLIKDNTGEKFISNKYTLLGKPNEVKEEDAMELVEAPEPYWEDNKNQKVIGNAEWSYTKSLLSLLESEIFWENPYEIPSSDDINWYRNQINGDFSERYTRVFDWYEAQSRTFDKSRTLIFVKN